MSALVPSLVIMCCSTHSERLIRVASLDNCTSIDAPNRTTLGERLVLVAVELALLSHGIPSRLGPSAVLQ